MNIQDTLSNTEQKLDNSEKIKIYLCGVTVYDESHIGHARTIIVFDVLRKYLENKKQQVELIQNFTDVDDKIINRAKDEKVSAQEISKRYIENYDSLKIKNDLVLAMIIPDKDIIPGAATLSPAYLVFENYEKILNWNRSLRFALAVCTLKDSFKNEI